MLCVSAHWFPPGTLVTAQERPLTIHDFSGIPHKLYGARYPAPGDPQLAIRERELLAPVPIVLDDCYGLNHGAWSVLCHVFPQVDVPVV